MKKVFYLVVLVCAMVCVVTSCDKTSDYLSHSGDLSQDSNTNEEPQTTTLTVAAPEQSKLCFSGSAAEGINLSWVVGDKFTIYKTEGETSSRVGDFECISIDATTQDATFSGVSLTDKANYIAVYPQSEWQTVAQRDSASLEDVAQIGNDTYSHLDKVCRMKSEFSYSITGSSVVFSHELSLVSLVNSASSTPKMVEVVVGEYNDIKTYRANVAEDGTGVVVQTVNILVEPRLKDEAVTVRFYDNEGNAYGFVKSETLQDFVAGGHYLASSDNYESLDNYQSHQGDELEFTITGAGASADIIPVDGVVKNFVTDCGGAIDDENGVSTLLQSEINSLSASGGGIIYFPKGIYYICYVELKSNVHLQFEAGSIVRPMYGGNSGKVNIFGLNDGSLLSENVSICGVNGRFIVEITQDDTQKGYFLTASSVRNFLVSDIDIYDVVTEFPMLLFTPDSDENPDVFGPTNGTIRNLTAYDCHYGYGLTQVHCGKDLYFENLDGVGGVTLRLETGATSMNEAQFGGVFNIMARDIRCTNGNAALMIAPHSMHNGIVQIDGVTSISSGFAVRTEGGYISSKYDPELVTEAGTFAEGCFVKNVVATYGHSAQIKSKHFQYLPDYFTSIGDYGDYYNSAYYINAPAIAAFLSSDNLPEVKVGKVESYGFLNTPVIH